jgi:hypothetical protein
VRELRLLAAVEGPAGAGARARCHRPRPATVPRAPGSPAPRTCRR